MHRASFNTMILVSIVLFGLTISAHAAEVDAFPVYDNIQPNISFWTMVYSKYSTQQAIVHDAKDLSIIYDVIDLKAYDAVRARKVNRQRMKRAKAKYQKVLKHLAAHPATKNKTARRVAALFGPKVSADIYRKAGRRVRCQIGQRDRFKAGLIRSGAYITQIREIFNSNGLPQTLANLPHVESSFNYQALHP